MTLPDLFPDLTAPRAIMSSCERYRYTLTREWRGGEGRCLFVMLNPSTADAERDDPTIRRCVGFARSWGFAALDVANLFAWRSTEPAGLLRASDPVGPDTDFHLVALAEKAKLLVCAWGDGGKARKLVPPRAWAVMQLLWEMDPHQLGETESGQPKHPLYLPADKQPELIEQITEPGGAHA